MRGNRAVSSALSYALVVAITLSLTSGLVLGAEALVDEQRETAVRSQLEVVGQRLASTVATVDRMGQLDGTSTASITREFPRRIAGAQYRIRVVQHPAVADRGTIYLDSRDLNVNVSVPVRLSDTTLAETRINGGPLRVVYDPSTDTVRVENV